MDISNYIFRFEDAYCIKDSVLHAGFAILFASLWIKSMFKKKD
jgi:hypothetical protein